MLISLTPPPPSRVRKYFWIRVRNDVSPDGTSARGNRKKFQRTTGGSGPVVTFTVAAHTHRRRRPWSIFLSRTLPSRVYAVLMYLSSDAWPDR
jgi:hypothetical protein